MEHKIEYGPAFSLLSMNLTEGDKVTAEAGAMVSMDEAINIETKMRGGFGKALARSFLGGESFFMNHFTGTGEVTFASSTPGDIVHVPMSGNTLLAQSTSFICSSGDIEVDTKFGGAKSFFSGEGLFLLKVSGTGDLFLSSYGAITVRELNAGQQLKVDTGHMVAFEEGVKYEVKKVGGLKSTMLSGEGLVANFTGPGKVWMQTRSLSAFLGLLSSKMPSK
ncbi:TIGR00266 family protein [candidate division WOR-3 bacterium]|uniref:TIGR00266 family protein n=1 Tax=candidate division WOR-3 bacterium TaxID=2052148 RepID=A0A9D5KBI6_UNCW3|nr:TIGR00266 family protein [candidate division WOR-3 bacterium]MBD3365687.1 TIGR00266 family protein [candidate division WOR-3 bacterium]